ncbi:MAG: hypothetical protein AAF198_05670 [Pseudomonadota bacterium]
MSSPLKLVATAFSVIVISASAGFAANAAAKQKLVINPETVPDLPTIVVILPNIS